MMQLPSQDQMKSMLNEAARRAGTSLASASQSVRKSFARTATLWNGLDRPMLAYGGIALAALVLLSINLIAGTTLKGWRADLTADGLFTISNATRRVVANLDEPIDVRVYYSQQLGQQAPSYGNYFERVRALLERYRDLSKGKLQLSFISPEPFSDAEDRAVAAGLRGVRLNNEGDTAYFGLVATNSTDNSDSIAFFSPDREAFLEYDLTKLVYGLANPKKKAVALISGLPLEGGMNPMMGRQTPPWMIVSQIREFFEVKSLGPDAKEIPADVDTLLLVEPSGLTPEAAFAIDQFALKGGRILAFVDPVPDVGRLMAPGMGGGDGKELKKLLDAWGVSYDPTKVAADIAHARRVQLGSSARPVVTEYVAWLGLDRKNLDAGDVLSGGIETLNLATPGYLAKAEGASTNFQPILETSNRASILDASQFGLRPDPIALLRGYKPGGKALVLAARVTGDIKTAYPQGAPKAAEKPDKAEKAAGAAAPPASEPKSSESDSPGPVPVASGKLNAIIVADTDMLHDQFWVDVRDLLGQQIIIPTAHNGTFVLNALENLSGGDALSGLRGRGVKNRPFELVDDIRREAERRFREKEQTLVAKLKETEQKLADLEQKGEGGAIILTDKDRETVEKFRTEMLGIRRELRDVKLAMRQDIDRLDGVLKFANIAAVPLLIGLGAVGLTIMRRRRGKTP